MNKFYTVTFGDVAENHVGKQKIGTLAKNGYSPEQIIELYNKLLELGLECEIINLNEHLLSESDKNALVLVIKKGVQYILQTENTAIIMEEHENLPMDKKASMRGRVVNKHARYNLCFADFSQ
jgi:hypothetical protein